MTEGLLTAEEVRQYLGIDQDEIDRLVQAKKLPCFKIGGTYLRYPKDQVITLRTQQKKKIQRVSWQGRTLDFWRYNGFYLISTGLLILVLYFALQ
ncbi:MAG: helix-turn-helix domain-containing protein [Candidatus Omnitrophica bacterium]|nr:helix-turn-helix domain-containing protein [Candidatus Omnitrophota bacterium]